jgi:hypothetical protein
LKIGNRGLDRLPENKERLEMFPKERLGTPFKLEYDILFRDITSTYFEGEMQGCPMAKRGYSRDRRSGCGFMRREGRRYIVGTPKSLAAAILDTGGETIELGVQFRLDF